MRTWILAVVVASIVVAAAPRSATAQTETAVAEKLFREAKSLIEKKDFATACPKLAESQRLDPASGTLLALAACHEAQGKIATAWGEYTSAISLSKKDGNPKREKVAAARAALLEPKLSYVNFDVASEAVDTPGLELRKDGVLLGAASWHDVPIDPGEHTVEVTAPKRKAYSEKFIVDDKTVTVHVPVLEAEALPPAPPPPPPPARFPMRTVGFVTGSAGIGAVVVGGVLGSIAIAKAHDVNQQCTPSVCTDQNVVNENNTAKTFADMSTVLVVVGILAAGGGAALVIAAPKAEPVKPSTGLFFSPGPAAAGAAVGWRF